MSQNPTGGAVTIVEVGPRDGLQNISTVIPTTTKLELISRLRQTGLQSIEITSAVSPRAIPQLSDSATVLRDPEIQRLLQIPNTHLPVLVPNLKGLEKAKQHAVKEIAVFVSAAEGFSRANIKCSVQEGLDRAQAVAAAARESGILVRGYVSCIFECPFDGPTPSSAVLNCARQLLAMGCYEISLGDTLGVGSPSDVVRLLEYLENGGIPKSMLAGHFHDTYGQALANVWAAYQCGVRVFDASVAGLGGCPYALGAKGNLATEDVVYMFQRVGVETGVDLPKLVAIGVWISKELTIENSSRAGKALASKDDSKKNQSTPTVRGGPGSMKPQNTPNETGWLNYKSDEELEVLRSGVNVKIILNRPKNGNALTTTMITTLTNLFENAKSDRSISRIIITGRGKFFCTGMDLAKGSTPVSQGVSASDAQYERLTRLFECIDNAPQVTIACVQGPAFGGGAGLAFACDIRIMAATASFTLSEVKLGLAPATISKYVIREWGPAFTREAILSARRVEPAELARLGVVSRVLKTGEDLDLVLDSYLANLKTSAPHASALGKELVRLACLDGSQGSKQAVGIQKLFGEMMSNNKEAVVGLKEFQAGNKNMDWDAYSLKQVNPRPKL